MKLSGTITSRHSNKHPANGQSIRHDPSAGVAVGRVLLFALVMMVVGCTSIYHRTRSGLPADPATEVELRISEARKAGVQASQAGKKLLGHLRQGKADPTISADFDRLEVAAFEVERRALAARDAVGRHGASPDASREIERLFQHAHAWLACVQTNRSADRATQIGQLEALLARPPDSRGSAK